MLPHFTTKHSNFADQPLTIDICTDGRGAPAPRLPQRRKSSRFFFLPAFIVLFFLYSHLKQTQVVGESTDAQGAGGEEDPSAGKADEFEFVAGAEGGDGGVQTLAPATEEQVEAQRAAAAAGGGERADAAAGEPPSDDVDMEDAHGDDVDSSAAADAAAPAPAPAPAPERRAGGDASRKRGAAASRQPGALSAPPPSSPAPPQPITAAGDNNAEEEAAATAAAAALERALLPPPGSDTALVSARLASSLRLGETDDGGGDGGAPSAPPPPPPPPLTEAQLASLRDAADEEMAAWRASGGGGECGGGAHGAALWARFEALTSPLAGELCEQLRLILEPTLAARLAGDFRTGKRLNMRKVVPYIASDFRRDKIWLRRAKPSARRYQARDTPFLSFSSSLSAVCACERTAAARARALLVFSRSGCGFAWMTECTIAFRSLKR